MNRKAKHPRYRRQYEEHLQSLETILHLIDGILADTSPVLGLPKENPERQIKHLREAKVTLNILAHVLRKASEEEQVA